jgi:uncharacterized protein (TIGR02444 family)
MAAESTSFPANWRGLAMHNNLWRYACALYERPGVEPACLAIQATGSNVCLALCALWLENRQVAWSRAGADTLEGIALPWSHAVVTPLRQLRQQWRAHAQGDAVVGQLREAVKRLELQAEQTLLERLDLATLGWPTGPLQDLGWLDWAVPDAGARLALRKALASV